MVQGSPGGRSETMRGIGFTAHVCLLLYTGFPQHGFLQSCGWRFFLVVDDAAVVRDVSLRLKQ